MTVTELAAELMTLEPDAEVYFSSEGGLRPVTDLKIIRPQDAGLPSYFECPILIS